jgi:hypothetical protein
MNLTEANRVWEALIISNGPFNFGESTTINVGLCQDVLRREQLIHSLHPITLQLAFCPSLISGDDINGDSAVSAMTKLNSLKD